VLPASEGRDADFEVRAPSRRLFVRLRDDIDERLLVPFDAERLPDFLLRERDEPTLVPRFVCRAPRCCVPAPSPPPRRLPAWRRLLLR
jgi:hypothetical protein